MGATLGMGNWKTPGRKTVESCPVLDVNQLSAMGYLLPGWAGSWVLGSNGERIPIVQVPSNLGRGSLPYFICPGEGAGGCCCGRRVRKL
jgi:hypothetical protein